MTDRPSHSQVNWLVGASGFEIVLIAGPGILYLRREIRVLLRRHLSSGIQRSKALDQNAQVHGFHEMIIKPGFAGSLQIFASSVTRGGNQN